MPYDGGVPTGNRERMQHQAANTAAPPSVPSRPTLSGGIPLRDRVQSILDLIRPAVQSDGGDVELLDVTPTGLVRVRMHGACVGCPSSGITLRQGIERNLRDHIPEVTGVQAVD
jgi:Fe-S cluster biogenesis protein NfuA